MKPCATLVNVGRGGVIDELALIQALREQRLAGAAHEVFTAEPLPTASPLWDLPNVLVSPHTAALSVHENERIAELFRENLGRYLRGEELHSRVDPKLFTSHGAHDTRRPLSCCGSAWLRSPRQNPSGDLTNA